MDIGIVSMRYARALMEYVAGSGAEEELYREMSMLTRSYELHPGLRAALENPTMSADRKFSLIVTAAAGDGQVGEEFRRFIGLVLKNRREGFLQYICLNFISLYRKSKHIGVARLTTAVPVSKEVEERIRNSASSMLHARMELQTKVDASIEGGFIFDINDYRLDASVATQLKRVKKQFIDKNKRIV